MRKIFIIMTIIAFTLPAFSQKTKLPEILNSCDKVSVKDIKMVKEEDKLKVSFIITPAKKRLRSNYKVTLTPYLYNIQDTVALEPIEIVGKQWARKERQLLLLTGRKNDVTVKIIPKEGESRYEVTLPYRRYMDNLSLRLVESTEGCCTANVTGNEELVNSLILRTRPAEYKVSPLVSYIVPPTEPVKVRKESGVAYLQFEKGKYRLLPELGDNERELSQIRESVDVVNGDKNTEIKGISLVGYASPEGTYPYNMTLSQNRTKVVADYIRNTYKLPKKFFSVESLSEDWKGLAQLVAADTTLTTDKEALLAIINSDIDPDLKERQIANFEKYEYIFATLYPKLRRTTYRIDYTVKGFTVEESREIIKKRSSNLSLSEMFLLANSYSVGSSSYNEIFEIALSKFPDDPTANCNAAASALANGDCKSAEKYLLKAGNSSQAENNRGVLYMLQGEYEKAEQAFRLALKDGSAESERNIEQLRQKVANVLDIDEYDSVD